MLVPPPPPGAAVEGHHHHRGRVFGSKSKRGLNPLHRLLNATLSDLSIAVTAVSADRRSRGALAYLVVDAIATSTWSSYLLAIYVSLLRQSSKHRNLVRFSSPVG